MRGSFLSRDTSNTLVHLRERFDAWVFSYNEYPHSATTEAPIKRFAKHIQCIRPAPDDLRDYFRKAVKRTVARDRTVALISTKAALYLLKRLRGRIITNDREI